LTGPSDIDETLLDNFQLSAPVPEPGSWALMAAGLMLMAPALRRRSSRKP
jgi:hypothetical protein